MSEGLGTGKHRLRSNPFPDELDQQFCEEDETLCMPGRPCLCCWVAQTEAAEEEAADRAGALAAMRENGNA